MSNLHYLLLFLINVIHFCNACFPNSPVERGPVITIGEMMESICEPNPCPTLTGTLITVSTEMVDSSCVYSATATCDVAEASVEFNGAGPTYSSPETLICDTTTSQYTYTDGGGIQQQITSIQCSCDPNPCPTLSGSLVTVSAAIVDANCIYTATASCDVSNADVEYNGAGPTYPDPQTLTCDTATSQYTYTDGGGIQQQITSIKCICDPNPCAPITATGLVVSPDMVDSMCVYTITADCTIPGMTYMLYNGGLAYGGTQIWTCDTTTSQWTFLDFMQMPVQIMSVMCIP